MGEGKARARRPWGGWGEESREHGARPQEPCRPALGCACSAEEPGWVAHASVGREGAGTPPGPLTSPPGGAGAVSPSDGHRDGEEERALQTRHRAAPERQARWRRRSSVPCAGSTGCLRTGHTGKVAAGRGVCTSHPSRQREGPLWSSLPCGHHSQSPVAVAGTDDVGGSGLAAPRTRSPGPAESTARRPHRPEGPGRAGGTVCGQCVCSESAPRGTGFDDWLGERPRFQEVKGCLGVQGGVSPAPPASGAGD